jgi:transposase
MKKIPIVAVQPMRDGSVQHALAPVHVQDQRTKAETLARLEQMRAYVDWKLKTTSGKYKLEWLLWKRKLDRLIEQANAGAVCRSHGHRSTRPNASLSNVRIFFFFPNRDAPDRIRADWAGTTSFIVAERKRHKSIGVLPRRSAANYRAYSKQVVRSCSNPNDMAKWKAGCCWPIAEQSQWV